MKMLHHLLKVVAYLQWSSLQAVNLQHFMLEGTVFLQMSIGLDFEWQKIYLKYTVLLFQYKRCYCIHLHKYTQIYSFL